VYSRIREENEKFRAAYLTAAGTIAIITFPMMLGMMGVSNYFVMVFFGEKWRVVSLLLVIFSPIGLLQSIEATTGAIYLAQSRTDWMFRWGITTGIICVVSFIIGLRWGIIGVASSYLIATFVLTYPGFMIPFSLIGLKMKDLLGSIWRPFLCSVLMMFTVFIASFGMPTDLSKGAALSIFFLISVASYCTASLLINRRELTQVLMWIRESFA